MADETGISFPDGGMCASDSGMSFHSCTKRDYHYLYKENKYLRARIAELETLLRGFQCAPRTDEDAAVTP